MQANPRLTILTLMFAIPFVQATPQEQSRESMAVDATASQWSFQLAYEGAFDYRTDNNRPEGNKGFVQFRLVAPIPADESFPITLLPRLTLRMIENASGDRGFGSSDIFILGIAQQWSTGRWGIGPQINFPAAAGFGNTNWGYGLAAAITERAFNDKFFFALLLQQTWSKNTAGTTRATPLGINPVIVYQLGGGYYLSNGDFVMQYNWDDGSWFVPLLLRVGKAWIGSRSTWNAYVEYGTSVIYESWTGPVATHILRVNVQYQLPVGL
ncbi:MAG: hypothetical protein OEV30_08565 [Ignavibacteria bacterium]|nr:hypothetical protein [Ignavibacteria bacterium]